MSAVNLNSSAIINNVMLVSAQGAAEDKKINETLCENSFDEMIDANTNAVNEQEKQMAEQNKASNKGLWGSIIGIVVGVVLAVCIPGLGALAAGVLAACMAGGSSIGKLLGKENNEAAAQAQTNAGHLKVDASVAEKDYQTFQQGAQDANSDRNETFQLTQQMMDELRRTTDEILE